jgi:hypothetical protein
MSVSIAIMRLREGSVWEGFMLTRLEECKKGSLR